MNEQSISISSTSSTNFNNAQVNTNIRQDKKIKYNILIAKGLTYLMEERNISCAKIAQDLEERYHYSLNTGNISKYLHWSNYSIEDAGRIQISTKDAYIQLHDLIQLLDYFDITFDELLQKSNVRKNKNMIISSPFQYQLRASDCCEDFDNYVGEYYCYFFPTKSKEKKPLTGKLTIHPGLNEDGHDITFAINLKKADGPYKKEYKGNIYFSKKLRHFYCILYSSKLCEMCFLSFKHITLNHIKLDCRLCEALTVSAGGDSHNPTVHRLFFSREEIKPAHYEKLFSMIKLTSSRIILSKKNLDKLIKKKLLTQNIADAIIRKYPLQETIMGKESGILEAIEEQESDKTMHLQYLANVLNYSQNEKYNKTSSAADNNIRQLLIDLGYYNSSSN